MSNKKKNPNKKTNYSALKKDDTDYSNLDSIPINYQDIANFYAHVGNSRPFDLRKETISRIEKITQRPLLCYVSKTNKLLNNKIPTSIEDSDLVGFGDLVNSIPNNHDKVDIFIVSNGGSPDSTERIVELLQASFKSLRFIIPSNAFSAATLMSFSGEEIIIDSLGTLGPIDPQINGIPAKTIIKGFEKVQEILKKEGPNSITPFLPLIQKYDLHLFEICRDALELSKELAVRFLKNNMLNEVSDKDIKEIVDFFSDYDIHKSHGKSINRNIAKEKGLKIIFPEETEGLQPLIRSLFNQYEFWFNQTPFYKAYENNYGINWGPQIALQKIQTP